MREDRQMLMLTHLSQLLNFIIPLVLWVITKDKIYEMNEHGKSILNFQLSMILYAIICVPAILLLGLGVLGLIAIAVSSLVFPIVNAIKANNGESPSYPFTIKFVK